MKKFYQVYFGWKTPRAKKFTVCASASIFANCDEAYDYAEIMLEYNKKLAQDYKNRKRELICYYDVRIVELEDSSLIAKLLEGGD